MNTILLIAALTLLGMQSVAVAQHNQLDPGYLRQYYQQLQQQQQHGGESDAAPIYEQHVEQPEQYVPSGQQLRVKDTVQEQLRAQHQQQQQQQQTAYVAPAVREYLHSQPQAQQIQYQPQAQSVIYRPQHQPQAQQQIAQPRRPVAAANTQYLSAPRPKGKPTLEEEEEEYDDKNASYQFGFDVKDDEYTNYQNRKEVRDNGIIKGSYSVVDSDGFIRTVKYTADPKDGFKAEVIREPTDIVVKIPTPTPHSLLRHHAKAQEFSLKPQY